MTLHDDGWRIDEKRFNEAITTRTALVGLIACWWGWGFDQILTWYRRAWPWPVFLRKDTGPGSAERAEP